jgi:5'-AMP-activated protein kinase catalytic alpha subunit
VAIKVLEKSKMLSEADVVRVTREVNILKQVKHPNIAQLYQIIETPNKICLVLEYLPKGELYDFIVRHKKLGEAEAARFFYQLMLAVQHMHALCVSHRDLKPENLLLDDGFNLKVIDFGLSNKFTVETSLLTACGSPCYAAPEMIAGLPYSGPKVDVWSCGVVLYAMTVGKLPFDDPNAAELYRKIKGGKFSCPDYLSQDLRGLLASLLTVDPAERLTVSQTLTSLWLSTHSTRVPVKELGSAVFPIVLSKLQELGLDAGYTQQCLEKQKHNQLTTAYFLMLKKLMREGFVPRITSTAFPDTARGDRRQLRYDTSTADRSSGRLVTTKHLTPKPPTQTTRGRSSIRHLNLVNIVKAQEEGIATTNLLQPHPPTSKHKPSISPPRRVLKLVVSKFKDISPYQTTRNRSNSTSRSQSQKRSSSNGRNAILSMKRNTLAEAADVCWTSNRPISDVTEEVRRVLGVLKFSYRVTEEGFVWEHQQVMAELSLKRFGTLTIVKCRLMSGAAHAYRNLCSSLLCSIDL